MADEMRLADAEAEYYDRHGLEVRVVDGVLEGLWDDRWLPVDRTGQGGEPPTPTGTDLASAVYAGGVAYMRLRRVTDSLLMWRWGGHDDWSTWFQEFEPGTETQEIEGFRDYVEEVYPDSFIIGDSDDDELNSDGLEVVELYLNWPEESGPEEHVQW